MKMKRVRIGVVGIGNMGKAHARSIFLANIEGMCLTAVCDSNDDEAVYCEENMQGVTFFSNYNEMFDSGLVDAVIIAVPHKYHGDIAIAALEKGLHIVVEKPIDISVSNARQLNEVAVNSGKVFAIMLNQRTNQLFQKAYDIVRGGELGELKRSIWIVTNWYRTQQYYQSSEWRATWDGEGGGVLLNQAPHNLDIWQWICGMPISVTAHCDVAKYHTIQVEDDATIFTRYANGATGTFITSTGEYPGTNRLEISGTLGKIVLEKGVLKWWKLSRSERELCFDSKENSLDIIPEYIEIEEQSEETAHEGILQNFANAILHGENLLSPGIEGIHELTISNAAYLSQWCGNVEIAIPFDEDLFDKLLDERKTDAPFKEKSKKQEGCNGYEKRWQVTW